LYNALEQEEKIETSIIEKEEEIHLLICNRVWMKGASMKKTDNWLLRCNRLIQTIDCCFTLMVFCNVKRD